MDAQRYSELFLQETRELLQSLGQSLVALERTSGDEAELREIYRIMHTLKSMAATMGYQRMADLSHALETILDRVLQGTLPLTADLMDLLFKAADQIERLTAGGENGEGGDEDTEALLEELAHTAAGLMSTPSAARAEGSAPHSQAAAASPTRPLTTLRINVKQLDNLINLTGELLIIKSRLRTLSRALHDPALLEANEQLDRISESLQREVLQARMLPVGSIFGRFSRLVRDLGRELGKDVQLVVSGHEIELDRMVLDAISEPLIHLLRNAVAHGIESAEMRSRLGKPKTGTIGLSGSRAADRVQLEVHDDGKGIDVEEVRATAVSKGFVPAEQAQGLSPRELMAVLFLPGFSTATAVTEVFGRGVGLNVVKTRIEALKGSIEIKSASQQGTRFILRLPPTLAIVEALLVRVRGETFAIPMADVAEVLQINRADFGTQNLLSVRGKAIPLLDLAQALSLSDGTVQPGIAFVLIASLLEGTAGFVVDQVIGRQEIVIKPVERLLKQVGGLSGATILGDGRVVLILDLHALLREEVEHLTSARRS